MTLSPQLKEYVQRLATHYEEAITRLATKVGVIELKEFRFLIKYITYNI